jgi:hypothetical protein
MSIKIRKGSALYDIVVLDGSKIVKKSQAVSLRLAYQTAQDLAYLYERSTGISVEIEVE